MSESEQGLQPLVEAALAEISRSASIEDLEAIRVRLLGKKGEITEQLKSLGAMPADVRKTAGAKINEAKGQLTAALEQRREALEAQKLTQQLASETIDVTLPGRGQHSGGLHPVTRVRRRIEQIFRNAGFTIEDGPEIEDEWHNFEALNIPANHPARAMHDTFYFPDGRLLRTHTSPVQVRAMQGRKPPFRVIAPGRVYR
ncbi:MAG: phenylalanine--tRNA ligase subunit alpha, partial [Povalibacter sp.]